MIFLVARAMVFAFILFLPAQEPPDHPAYCVNMSGNPDMPMDGAHACMCHQTCDPLDPDRQGGEDPMCRNNCFKDHCHCVMTCPTT